MRTLILTFIAFGMTCVCLADFTFDDNGTSVTVLDGGKPVLAYHYGRMNPPKGIDAERYWRSSYIHPLYGLDGDVLTGDFQRDHPHHRGVYWTWPQCKLGNRQMDIWHLVGVRQLFERWLEREAGPDTAEIGVQNVWVFDDGPDPVVREQVRLTVHRADNDGRAIDFHLSFTNVSAEVVTIKGQNGAGYGGLCLRADRARRNPVITTARGVLKKDSNSIGSPWADFSSPTKRGGPNSGAAIFQHPKNPDYPHRGWCLRHYGFLGAAWPHDKPFKLQPAGSIDLRYRLYVHRGTAEDANVAEKHNAYVKAHK